MKRRNVALLLTTAFLIGSLMFTACDKTEEVPIDESASAEEVVSASETPSEQPTTEPTSDPTSEQPTSEPTEEPTSEFSNEPTSEAVLEPNPIIEETPASEQVASESKTEPKTEAASESKTETKTEAPTSEAKKPEPSSSDTLRGAYENTFGYIGNCVSPYQLKDANTLAFIKKHNNSITPENEFKPDSLLSKTLISTNDAKSKGYYIPDGYAETQVPTINFEKIDSYLKIAADNGLKIRFHVLVWHSQTPDWFFKTDFSGSSDVSKDVMDKRMEFYIKSIMNHVYADKNGSVVYAWDVVNEHFHNNGGGGWQRIYKDDSYVVSAFKYARQALDASKVKNVSLFYNDYNTYEVATKIIDLINKINADGKNCDGVGMQSHLDVGYPSVTLIGNTIDKFKEAGLEIQITELDATLNGPWYKGPKKTEDDQAQFYGDLFKMFIKKKNDGAKITGITFWGLYDDVSWRKANTPLIFSGIDKPKDSFTAIINAKS